jgi:hypothetical protein
VRGLKAQLNCCCVDYEENGLSFSTDLLNSDVSVSGAVVGAVCFAALD